MTTAANVFKIWTKQTVKVDCFKVKSVEKVMKNNGKT